MTDEQNVRARTFLTENSVGVLATVAPDGTPRARTVYYAANDSFEIFLLTLAGTRKVEDINAHAQVAFVVSDPALPATLQIEGTLSAQPDTAAIDPMVSRLMDTLMQHGDSFAPVTHLDQQNILFYKLTPSWIRFGDFSKGQGTDEVFSVITP